MSYSFADVSSTTQTSADTGIAAFSFGAHLVEYRIGVKPVGASRRTLANWHNKHTLRLFTCVVRRTYNTLVYGHTTCLVLRGGVAGLAVGARSQICVSR